VHIWESALGVSPIGIDDDFFDLGGDSITAIQTQFSIADEFGVDLSASAFFDFPTIAGLAGRLLANSDMPTSVTESVRTDVLQHDLS
jgi:acyl carrier protein